MSAKIVSELQELHQLRQNGVLTAEEFVEAKALILSRGAGEAAPKPPVERYDSQPGTQTEKPNFKPALTAFILGLVSLPFHWIGIIPLLAIGTGWYAAYNFDPQKYKNGWMAPTGIVLGILSTITMLAYYKHI